MKKNTLVIFGVAILFLFASCGSNKVEEPKPAPKPPVVEKEEPKPVPQPVITEEPKDSEEDEADKKARENAKDAYAKALEAKKKIDDNDLAKYNQKDYDAGEVALREFDELQDDAFSTGKELEDKAKEALHKFNEVINAAYKKLAKEERELAYQAKKKADSVKAGVAEKEKYQSAVDDFKNGDALFAMQSPEKSYEEYKSAKEIFNALYELIYERRAAAQAAIEEAKKRVQESAAFADEADRASPLSGEKVEGIEDEETRLLSDDEYENPDDAVADIPVDIDDNGNPVEGSEDIIDSDYEAEEKNTDSKNYDLQQIDWAGADDEELEAYYNDPEIEELLKEVELDEMELDAIIERLSEIYEESEVE